MDQRCQSVRWWCRNRLWAWVQSRRAAWSQVALRYPSPRRRLFTLLSSRLRRRRLAAQVWAFRVHSSANRRWVAFSNRCRIRATALSHSGWVNITGSGHSLTSSNRMRRDRCFPDSETITSVSPSTSAGTVTMQMFTVSPPIASTRPTPARNRPRAAGRRGGRGRRGERRRISCICCCSCATPRLPVPLSALLRGRLQEQQERQ